MCLTLTRHIQMTYRVLVNLQRSGQKETRLEMLMISEDFNQLVFREKVARLGMMKDVSAERRQQDWDDKNYECREKVAQVVYW